MLLEAGRRVVAAGHVVPIVATCKESSHESTSATDFEDWAGYEAKIEVREMISGRKRFRGIIDGFEAGEVRFETDVEGQGRQVIGLPVALIAEARLVLTDELIREALQRAKQAAKAAGRTDDLHDGAETDHVPLPKTAAEDRD